MKKQANSAADRPYTLYVAGQNVPGQSQFFPADYGYVINDLVSRLIPADR